MLQTMLKETIIRDLRKAIVSGKYKPHEHLKEVSLCKRFKVSRTPIREALRQLEKEGLVETIPYAGARIVKLSKTDVSNIYDMIITIEGAASRLACPLISKKQIVKLEEYQFMLEKAAGDRNYDLAFEINHNFHKLIAECTQNPYLIQTWQNFRSMVNLFGRFTLSDMVPGQLKATSEEHPRIIEAMKNKNPAMAEFVAREHMETGRESMLEYLEKYYSD
jgi:DNA-binding GntR family transcriptional regulator